MHRNWTKMWFALVLAGFLATSAPVWCMDVNDFYRCFLGHLKDSRYSRLERLVRNNQKTAQKTLAILDRKIQLEKDSSRKEAYNMIVRELRELLAVVQGLENCVDAKKIMRRAGQTALSEDAAEGFRRATKLCPHDTEAFLGLAESYKRMGRFEETIAAYEKVLAMKADAPEALLGMGEVLYSAGLYDRGIPYLEKVLGLEADNKKAKALLASAIKESALDRDGIIPSEEIVTRLAAPLEGGLMCMCPVHAQLVSRIRFRSITFSTGSTVLSADARAQLADLALALKTDRLKSGRYLIDGHADPSGAKAYNLELSVNRAKAVKRYLMDVLNVAPQILSVSGVGDSRSWRGNDTPSDRRSNRRIEVISLGDDSRETK